MAELKARIHGAQQRAALAVNRELVLLYWQIGHDILARQADQGWGAKVIERLSQDLRSAFPEMKWFSRAPVFPPPFYVRPRFTFSTFSIHYHEYSLFHLCVSR